MTRKIATAACALAIITATTTPVPAQAPAVTGVVIDAVSGTPVANASVVFIDAGQTVTHSDGRYRFTLSPGSYLARVSRIGFSPATAAITVAAGANTRQDFALNRSAVPIDPLVSVGSRSYTRTATESALPVDVIDANAIASLGIAETWEVVQRLIPSVNVTRVPLADDQVRAMNLRGLSPDHVLVLVNGKRRHHVAIVQTGPVMVGTSPADINGIPPSAIERIEVLRDGAAAQYGSDAIAGVINIVLKRGERSEAVTSFSSTYTTEGGREFRDGLYRSVAVTRGIAFRKGGDLSITGQVRDREPTNRAYPDRRQQYFTGDPRNELPPQARVRLGEGATRDAALQIVANYPLTQRVDLYLTGGASRRIGSSTVADFRPSMSDNTVRAIHPDGYLPQVGNRITDFSTVFGARGSAGGWRWDLSSSLGSNSFSQTVYNTNNVSLGAESPTDFYIGKLRFSQWINNLDAVRRFTPAPKISVNVSTGMELRRDSYRISAGDPDSWRDGGVRILDGPRAGRFAPVGAQGIVGYRPTDEANESRHNISGYLDIEGRIVPAVLAGIAWRTERYSDFGSTNDARLALRLEPKSGIAVRGALGTGFRAPSLINSFYSSTRVVRLLGAPDNGQVLVRTLPVASPEAKLLGARPLRPEESLNRSAGIVLSKRGLPTVSADFYAIDIDGRIILTGTFFDSTIARFFADRGLRGVGGGRYFANAIDTRTRGLDIVATHGLSTRSAGVLRLTGAYNRTETRIRQVASIPPALAGYQSSFFSRDDSARVQVAQPRSGGVVTTGWSTDRFSVDLQNRRFGRTAYLSATPGRDQVFRPRWITDISASYRLARKLRASATVSNLFDVYPDEWRDFSLGVNGALSAGGTVRYPAGHTPYGVNGRTIYVHLRFAG